VEDARAGDADAEPDCVSLASPLARAVTALSSIYGGNPSRLAGP